MPLRLCRMFPARLKQLSRVHLQFDSKSIFAIFHFFIRSIYFCTRMFKENAHDYICLCMIKLNECIHDTASRIHGGNFHRIESQISMKKALKLNEVVILSAAPMVTASEEWRTASGYTGSTRDPWVSLLHLPLHFLHHLPSHVSRIRLGRRAALTRVD